MTSISSRSSATVTPSNTRTHLHSVERGQQDQSSTRRIPVTPAVLRSIFASSRTPHEERSISRIAFFRFAGFLLSCVCISFAAARGRGLRNSTALLASHLRM
ncbi:hypothetical protein CONPUDRAFT_54430 [Coniophora puteana RWD-64-598 SS2]|uniref:Uncharacterized protein n=1 Tax=Coniophora puteana (strain RWD-64-598) TaxID=741705 RepID=A0A5M3MT36_CONPW|nr:uncharacterized protein CONPUDRAFT_54430 [Coniophora puteana RWD-64-598 SS2]EIW82338.1 hypothetical protein CONPUDRAFT_54430 [Coniophora puteana RWD-64-598 SS2]